MEDAMMTKRKYLERKFIILLSILLFTLPVFAQDHYYTDKLFGKHFVFTPKETDIGVDCTPCLRQKFV
jgi:hypothetical protein